jgi:hypothetical protein
MHAQTHTCSSFTPCRPLQAFVERLIDFGAVYYCQVQPRVPRGAAQASGDAAVSMARREHGMARHGTAVRSRVMLSPFTAIALQIEVM